MSQRELAQLMGYDHQGQISRHERSQTIPPLSNALGYEVVFRVPLSAIFAGLHGTVAKAIEANLATFEESLRRRSHDNPRAKGVAQKLQWLAERRNQ